MLHGLPDPLWAKQTQLQQRKSYTQKHFQRDKPTISGIMSEHLINIYLSLEKTEEYIGKSNNTLSLKKPRAEFTSANESK